MPKKRELRVIFEDILGEIVKIRNFVKDIGNVEDFSKNELVFYAVLKALENIGEAVKYIPDDKRKLCQIEWRKIAGLRDIIAHEYFGIDTFIIWDVINNKLPELEKAIIFLMELEGSVSYFV